MTTSSISPASRIQLTSAVTLASTQRIAHGLFKKFVLAYAIKTLFLTDFSVPGLYWLLGPDVSSGSISRFQRYSDIAVGIEYLHRQHLHPRKFQPPLLFQKYDRLLGTFSHLHVPLDSQQHFLPRQVALLHKADGKKPLLCGSIAFTAAFIPCGLWHGIAWNFVAWGGMHATGLIMK